MDRPVSDETKSLGLGRAVGHQQGAVDKRKVGTEQLCEIRVAARQLGECLEQLTSARSATAVLSRQSEACEADVAEGVDLREGQDAVPIAPRGVSPDRIEHLAQCG